MIQEIYISSELSVKLVMTRGLQTAGQGAACCPPASLPPSGLSAIGNISHIIECSDLLVTNELLSYIPSMEDLEAWMN